MWDWIKETAATVANAGAQYLTYSSFIEGLMNMAYEQAHQALREKVFELDDDGYQAFLNVLSIMYSQTEQQLNRTAQNGSSESWGSSFEDQMAQSLAEIQAGVSHGPNPVYQQLQWRLQNLEAIAQYCQTFRQEALTASTEASAVEAPQVGEEIASNSATSASHVAQGLDAFQRHARDILAGFSNQATDGPVASEPDAELDEMAALQLYVQTDSRVTSAMMRLMPGSADTAVIDELKDICQAYGRVLAGPASSHGMYSDADLHRKIGQALSFAAMAAESLRDDRQALEFHRQALQAYEAAGDQGEIDKCHRKIDGLEILLSGDTDAEIERLQLSLLEQQGPSFGRVETLISLGETLNRNGDSFGSKEHLHDAEELLVELGHDNPGSGDLAQSLMSSMQALMAGEARAGDTGIEQQMAIRGLYTRLYHGLAAAYRDDDVDRASDYLDRAEAMDSQTSSQDFGKEMMSLLNTTYKDLLK